MLGDIPVAYLCTQKNAHCRYNRHKFQRTKQYNKTKTIRDLFVFFASNALANGISCFLLCFSVCHLVKFGPLPPPQPHIYRLTFLQFVLYVWTNDFNLYQKHSIVWRGPQFDQHLQNRFLLRKKHHSNCAGPGLSRSIDSSTASGFVLQIFFYVSQWFDERLNIISRIWFWFWSSLNYKIKLMRMKNWVLPEGLQSNLKYWGSW